MLFKLLPIWRSTCVTTSYPSLCTWWNRNWCPAGPGPLRGEHWVLALLLVGFDPPTLLFLRAKGSGMGIGPGRGDGYRNGRYAVDLEIVRGARLWWWIWNRSKGSPFAIVGGEAAPVEVAPVAASAYPPPSGDSDFLASVDPVAPGSLLIHQHH